MNKTRSNEIAILHAQDSTDEAKKIQKILQDKGFIVLILEEVMSKADYTIPLSETYNKIVDEYDKVISLVSDDLFANCYLGQAIRRAHGLGKLLTVTKTDSKVIIPTWYMLLLSSYTDSFQEAISRLN